MICSSCFIAVFFIQNSEDWICKTVYMQYKKRRKCYGCKCFNSIDFLTLNSYYIRYNRISIYKNGRLAK